jgi:hypothetical protein
VKVIKIEKPKTKKVSLIPKLNIQLILLKNLPIKNYKI